MKNETPTTGPSGSHNTHARFSPVEHQWVRCTASIAFIAANSHRIPADNSTEYSRLGTEAHDWAAKVLLNEATIDDVPEEFHPYVKSYVENCLSLVPEGVSYQTEISIPLFYQPAERGTGDFVCVTDSCVIVEDYKHGAGVLVEAFENEQLAVYGFSAVKMFEDIYDFSDDTVVHIGVHQPRHREAADQKPWRTTLGELREFCKPIEYAYIQGSTGLQRVHDKIISTNSESRDISAKEILEAAPGLRFAPGEGDGGACRFCKAKAICEVRLASATEGMDAGGMSGAELIALLPDLSKEDKKLPVEERIEVVECEVMPPGETGILVSDEYLVNIYRNSKAIRRFLDDVEEHLENRAIAGDAVPGTKLVEGRAGNRAWANEEEADTFLRGKKLKESERYNFKLKSPTEMEKVLDIPNQPKRTQTRWNELVVRSPGKPVLALADDKRDAITAPIDMLPDLGADDEV